MAAVAQARRPSALTIFRNRAFALMWAGQLVSTAGSAITALAGSVLVFRLTGSALGVGLLLMATAAPTLVFGLVAGVFVDRYNRKRIMIGADLTRALLAALIPLLAHRNIVWLYALVMMESAVGQFFDPAHASVLPDVASDEELAAANSLMAISSFGASSIGSATAGLIAAGLSIDWAFYLDAVSFVVSALCIAPIAVGPVQTDQEAGVATVVRNLRAGARFLFDTPILRSQFLIFIPCFALFGFNNAAYLPFAVRILHANSFQYGVMESLRSVGFVLASLLLASLVDRLREGRWIALSLTGMGIFHVAYALSTSIPAATAAVMVCGFLNAPSVVARQLIIQRNTPREVRGRVNSAFYFIRSGAWLMGMAAAGLADRYDIRLLYILSALGLAIVGTVALFLPGLGQPAAEWRRLLRLARPGRIAPATEAERGATREDLAWLARQLPLLARMSLADRQEIAAEASVSTVPAGAVILRRGEMSDSAYFILDGRVIVGQEKHGRPLVLGVLNAGDFFGEIAALAGVPRTAQVVAERTTTLLRVPRAALQHMMRLREFSQLVYSTLSERVLQLHMADLAIDLSGLDQQALLELRTPSP